MWIFWREAYQDVAVCRVKGLKDGLTVHLHQDSIRIDDWPGSFRATHSSPHGIMQFEDACKALENITTC